MSSAKWRLFCLGFNALSRNIPMFNKLRMEQNGHLFADGIFICIFLNENFDILMQNSLKFVPKSPTDILSAYV